MSKNLDICRKWIDWNELGIVH